MCVSACQGPAQIMFFLLSCSISANCCCLSLLLGRVAGDIGCKDVSLLLTQMEPEGPLIAAELSHEACCSSALSDSRSCVEEPERSSRRPPMDAQVSSLWAPPRPEAVSSAAGLPGGLSPRLTSLCSASIVPPASGMLRAAVFLALSALTHPQTHIYVGTYLLAHLTEGRCCESAATCSIFTSFTASGLVVCPLPGNHITNGGLLCGGGGLMCV